MPTRGVIRDISTTDKACRFVVIKGTSGLANAIRRALMNDVVNLAPKSIHILKNTTCQTDEYIAHRVGLIPFHKKASVDAEELSMSLSVKGETAYSDHLVDSEHCRVAPCHRIPIIKMSAEQELKFTVAFETGSGSVHSRFSHIGPVAFKIVDDSDVEIRFETFGKENASEYAHRALLSLASAIDKAVYFMQTQYDSKCVVARETENMDIV